MSDNESMWDGENESVLGEGKDVVLLQRTLVHLVQQFLPLYDKKLKEYCGKRFDKAKGWDDVSRAMIPGMTGPEAQKEFYKIRQRFGKELRAYRQSCVGKSGQGNKGRYVSKWPLYDECLFLADIITPKKTTGNYTSVPKCLSTVSIPIQSASSSSTPVPSPSPTPSAAWSSDGDLFSICSDRESLGEGTSNCTNFISPPPVKSREQVLSAMQRAATSAKRSTPEADAFAVKKRKQEDELVKSMVAQSRTLTTVAEQFGAALQAQAETPAPATPTAADDPLLGTIKFALETVPAQKKIHCLLPNVNNN